MWGTRDQRPQFRFTVPLPDGLDEATIDFFRDYRFRMADCSPPQVCHGRRTGDPLVTVIEGQSHKRCLSEAKRRPQPPVRGSVAVLGWACAALELPLWPH